MSVTRAEVLAAVNADPRGFTAAQLAEQLRRPRYNVGSILSKLAAYGHIDKIEIRGRSACLWRRKAGT